MPLDVTVDHAKRLVIARGRGVLSGDEVVEYQRTTWARPDVKGYDELVDMSEVTEVAAAKPAGGNFRSLASESAAADTPDVPTKFAIVAVTESAYGLARMYQTYRELDPRSTKQTQVFRTLPEALAFLGVESL